MRTQNLSTLTIHKLTDEQYNNAMAAGIINENELYLTEESTSGLPPVTEADDDKVLIVKNGEWGVSEASFPKYTLTSSETDGKVLVSIIEKPTALTYTNDGSGNLVLSIGG